MLPRTMQQQIIEKKLQVLRDRRHQGGRGRRHGRPHQHRHADLLLRHQRRAAARGSHRRHQARHREDLRQARRSGGAEELRRRGRSARPPARGQGSGRGHAARSTCGRRCRPRRPEFVQNVTGQDHRRRGRRAAGQRHARSTAPSPPAPRSGRSATSRWRSRSGTRSSASSAASASGLPARGDPRQGLRARRCWPRRPPTFKSAGRALEGIQGAEVHAAGGAGGLHRLRACASRSARPRARAKPSTRPSTWSPSCRCASAERDELGLLPRAPGSRPRARSSLGQVKDVAVAAAAVRVLRRLRRLRRDALHQADDAVLRRPRC